jgi:hypothetical protein
LRPGASTIPLAQEYPGSRFTGSDYHDESIEMVASTRYDQGVADRVSFEVASASTFRGPGTTRPPPSTACTTWATRWPRPGTSARRSSPTALAHRRARRRRRRGGQPEPGGPDVLQPSTLLCVPNALSQSGGYALGAQAGEAAIRQVITDASTPGSGAPPRPRSTSSTKSVPTGPGASPLAGWAVSTSWQLIRPGGRDAGSAGLARVRTRHRYYSPAATSPFPTGPLNAGNPDTARDCL